MSIGDTLAEARRQAGLTIAQVSERTRIRESIISSIERDDLSPCGGDFYARGHIRALAGAVGTDPAALIAEYDVEHGPGTLNAAEVFEPVTPIRIREPRRPRLGWVIAAAVIAAAGFGAYHALVPRGAKPTATATSRVRHSAAPGGHGAAGATAVGAAAADQSGAKPQAVIRLTARQACWVRLSTAGGKRIYEGTIQPGSRMTWREKHAVSMVIGNPPGVDLTVNGRTERLKTVQVVTLSIDPLSKTPVTVG